jgi:hypothetical protein
VVAGVIVNCLAGGDTAARNYRGSPWYQLPQDVYKHVAQAHGVPVHLHEAQAAFRSKRSCRQRSCSRILKRL